MQNNTQSSSPLAKRRFTGPTPQERIKQLNLKNEKIEAKLKMQLQEERIKNIKLQEEINLWKRRLVEREIELRSVIAKIESDREQSFAHSSSKGNIPNFISNLHGQIKNKIVEDGNQTVKWINAKQKSNLDHMERKLDALRKQLQEKFNQQKSLTLTNFEAIMSQLQDMRLTALAIDNQNTKLQSQIRELRITNKILSQQRNIAISENVVNSLKMKEMRNTDTRLSHRPSRESKRFKSQRNSLNLSLRKSFQVNSNSNNFNRFLGQPVFDSPTLKKPRPIKTTETPPQNKKTDDRQYKSILSLQRSLKRQKRKNFQMYTLFAQNSQKNNQLNEILWQSMDQARKQAESSGKTFQTCIVQNIVKTEEVIKNIQRMRQTDKIPKFRQKQTTIDLSDLKGLDQY